MSPLALVFDDNVALKNLASGFLSDPVAAFSGEKRVVIDTGGTGEVIFVHFGGVKEYPGTPVRIETGGRDTCSRSAGGAAETTPHAYGAGQRVARSP